MTQISKRLEQIVNKELSKTIIPVKTQEGILVGDILINSNGPIKNIYKNKELLYNEIYLNSVAIKIANMLALKKSLISVEQIYRADQEYGKWFNDSQMLRAQYQKAVSNQDFERADTLWARYCESRDRTIHAKNNAERLARL
jgi:hypothetical protein